jgi:hypothetical protein
MTHKQFTLGLFLLIFFTNLFGQTTELNDFKQKKYKTFLSSGHPKNRGLNFSIKYPKNYTTKEVKNENVVKGFIHPAYKLVYMVGIVKSETDFTKEDEELLLSEENLKKSVKMVTGNNQNFISYKSGLKINGMITAYLEYLTNATEDTKSYIRQYFLIYQSYFLTISFAVPKQPTSTLEQAKATFNSYKPFFEIAAQTLIVNSDKNISSNLEVDDYMKYKDAVPTTDKSKSNEEWNDEVYRNKKYQFRLQFPKQWEYDRGTSKSTLARALNREKGIAISLGVTHLPENPQYPDDISKSFSASDYKTDLLKQLLTMQNTKVENFNIRNGFLNNFPAYILQFTSLQSSGTKSYMFLSKQVHCYFKSKLYVLTINLPTDEWTSEVSIMFDRVIESFNFEIVY